MATDFEIRSGQWFPAVKQTGIAVVICVILVMLINRQMNHTEILKRGYIMKELFTVGELSKLFSMNIRTLRYYDQAGILKPEKTDSKTGYRYYSTRQFERLNTIKYLRALNMPIEKIAHFFDNKDTETMVDLLRGQQADICRKIADLQIISQKIDNRLTQIQDAVCSSMNRIEIRPMKKRAVLSLRREISRDTDLEYPIRELERLNELSPAMFLGKVGVSISAADLQLRKFDRFCEIFVFVEDEDRYEGKLDFLKEQDYLTIRFSGTHAKSDDSYNLLLDYMERENLRITGDSVEVTLIDSGLTNNQSEFVTELQIPFAREI